MHSVQYSVSSKYANSLRVTSRESVSLSSVGCRHWRIVRRAHDRRAPRKMPMSGCRWVGLRPVAPRNRCQSTLSSEHPLDGMLHDPSSPGHHYHPLTRSRQLIASTYCYTIGLTADTPSSTFWLFLSRRVRRCGQSSFTYTGWPVVVLRCVAVAVVLCCVVGCRCLERVSSCRFFAVWPVVAVDRDRKGTQGEHRTDIKQKTGISSKDEEI